MRDERNSKVQWMNLQWNTEQFRKSDMISFVVCEIWSHTPSASGSYGRQSDEILVDFEIFKSLYWIVLLGFSWSLTKVQFCYSVTNGFQSVFFVKSML